MLFKKDKEKVVVLKQFSKSPITVLNTKKLLLIIIKNYLSTV